MPNLAKTCLVVQNLDRPEEAGGLGDVGCRVFFSQLHRGDDGVCTETLHQVRAGRHLGHAVPPTHELYTPTDTHTHNSITDPYRSTG